MRLQRTGTTKRPFYRLVVIDHRRANKGGIITLVAIADVAHYVTPGSALDTEAYKRGNSVYFPDRVVPMLPETLSADLCSLKEGVDRACLAVRMVFDSKGKKRHHEFIRGIMRSAARLTYAQAQRAFDGHPDDDMSATARETLAGVWAAYQVLLKERADRDPLELDLPERRITIGVDGKIASIAYRERLESMKLIEEFMVLANVAAALRRQLDGGGPLRDHRVDVRLKRGGPLGGQL